jgi:hypothetical protein
MRNVVAALTLGMLLSFSATVLPGCTGSGEDEVLEYDPEVSEQKRVEYEQQMREAMQKQGRPGAPGPGNR